VATSPSKAASGERTLAQATVPFDLIQTCLTVEARRRAALHEATDGAFRRHVAFVALLACERLSVLAGLLLTRWIERKLCLTDLSIAAFGHGGLTFNVATPHVGHWRTSTPAS
jgi:hypothetical protein